MYKSGSQFRFRLLAINGENILHSESYVTRQGCLNGIRSVKANSPIDSRYNRRNASNGQFYFVLKASNGEIIGTSETYISKYGMENGISAVKRDAPSARIEDLTYATV